MKKLFLYILLFLSATSFAQNQTDNQYFLRNAGMTYDYCSNSYVPLTNSKITIEENQFQAGYSPSTISDKYGNLLFYTDGRTIWDRTQNPLPNANEDNGTDIEGHGNTLFLPKPGDSNLYYIFALDNAGFWNTLPDAPGLVADDGVNNGLTYSVVDLSLNNGLGDISNDQRNLPLITYLENSPKEVSIKCSNKLTVVRGSDCESYWIITHFTSSFYAFKLDSTGLNPNPVISTVVPLIDVIDFADLRWYHRSGEMKSSPDGTKIAVAHTFLDNEEINGNPGGVYLYDFDNETGLLSNTQTLFLGENTDEYPYSLEFSESSKYLYAATSDLFDTAFGTIFRWNTEATNIANSMETIQNNDAFDPKLLLGSDDNIYKLLSPISNGESDHTNYLGILNNVDGTLLDVNYTRQGLLLDPNLNFESTAIDASFPHFNRQWFNERIDIIKNDVSRCELYLCANQSKTLNANFIAGADYVWSKDGTVITSASSNTLEVTEAGYYEVYIEPNNGACPIEGRATVLVSNDVPTAQNAELIQCDDNNDGFTAFSLSLLNETISNNEANRSIGYYENLADLNAGINELNSSNYVNSSNPQTLYALVTSTENGCTAFSEVNLSVSITSIANFELSGCDTDGNSDGFGVFNLSDAASQILSNLPSGLNITFHESYENALSESFPLNSDYTNTIAYNQTLYTRIVNGLDCFGISEVQLKVYDVPLLNEDSEILYCLNNTPETITLNSGVTGSNVNDYTYLWSTEETASQIEVNETGMYSVVVTNTNGCSNERFITVLPSNIATVTDIQVTEISTNNSINIFVTGEGDYEYALNDISGPYQDSSSFFNLQPGMYSVFVRDKNDCGIVNDMVSILGFPKFFTPNGDGVNDTWQIKGMTMANQINSPILVFNRYGKLLIELNPLSPGWDGTLNGAKLPSSDYWFKVTLEDGRVLNSHFSLKR